MLAQASLAAEASDWRRLLTSASRSIIAMRRPLLVSPPLRSAVAESSVAWAGTSPRAVAAAPSRAGGTGGSVRVDRSARTTSVEFILGGASGAPGSSGAPLQGGGRSLLPIAPPCPPSSRPIPW